MGVLGEPFKLLRLARVAEDGSADGEIKRYRMMELAGEGRCHQEKCRGQSKGLAEELTSGAGFAEKPDEKQDGRWGYHAETVIAGTGGDRRKECEASEIEQKNNLAGLRG